MKHCGWQVSYKEPILSSVPQSKSMTSSPDQTGQPAIAPDAFTSGEPVQLDITVILCTFNRSSILQNALESLAAQIMPDSVSWEAIVVDNNSKDATRAVVNEYCLRHPGRFRYLFEPAQGLSRARNAGIRHARGAIIAFIDDDVTAETTWLQNLTAPLFTGKWAGAGGRVLPPRGFCPPTWLTLGGEMDLGGPLALFDLGNRPGDLPKPPYGTNMAFRKAMFAEHGVFREDLGRCGTGMLSGEDTEFGKRLMAAGEKLCYAPSAVIYHPVPEERLSPRYYRIWWFDFGRTRILERPSRPAVLGIPREFLSILNLAWRFLPLRTLHWVLTLKPRPRFYRKCQVWLTIGEIVQNYRNATTFENPARQIQ
jgi:glycosyltransferase involved in cell wall biosynthesis